MVMNTVHENKMHMCNKIVLIGKQYIHRCKCQGKMPNYNEVNVEVWLNYKIKVSNYFYVGKV